MEELYDNLDNYKEEHTIAELQTENKELKSKLEEYAVTLSKLQKEFDKLSSEYKQLELNYSSLLKTAKAEIERKTQIISHLNSEKDKMVLKSFKNVKAGIIHKSKTYNIQTGQQNCKKDKRRQDEKLKQFDGTKSSPSSASERVEHEKPSSRDTTASPHTDMRSKLLNSAHKGYPNDPRFEKCSEVKENVRQPENDIFKGRASIRDRRKSMPVLSVAPELISDDDDFFSNDDMKKLQQTNAEQNFRETHKEKDSPHHERPKSRISETCSLEENKSGYHEPIPHSHKPRSSRYDRDRDDKYKVRHKSSHRYKRSSPDKHQSGAGQYHHDSFHRYEHDRQRAKDRIIESPPRDRFHQRPSRELHRNMSERSHPYERERVLPRSQERYPMKRRFEHSYDELEKKRARKEPHSKQPEECRMKCDSKGLKMESHYRYQEEDPRNNNEMKLVPKKIVSDPFEIQFSSCESPDYDCPEVSNQLVKEIKLTATTKLDDPRASNKKYVLHHNDGQVVLSTTIGRNVNIVPIKKISWGITPVSMPEALIKRPNESIQSVAASMETENPANISIESGEIPDIVDRNEPQNVNKLRLSPSNGRKEPPVPLIKFDNSKDIEKSLKKLSSYKIPKHKKALDDKQSSKQTKDTLSVKPIHDVSDSFISNRNTEMTNKDVDAKTQQISLVQEKKEPNSHQKNSFVDQTKNKLPCLNDNDEPKYVTAKQVVEGDLEMSDDNEQSDHDVLEPIINTELENEIKNKDKSTEPYTEEQKTDIPETVTLEPCKTKATVGESKKCKSKKKSKHRETKEVCKHEESPKVFEKPAKKKEKEKSSKITQIKTKFSELFDDSSSLISPEDLGLTSVPAPITRLSNKCVPFFEDALDAIDVNTTKSDEIKIDMHSEKSNVGTLQQSDVTTAKIDTANIPSQDSFDKSHDNDNDVQTKLTDEVIKSLYQNLEPGAPEEDNVVKTVVISTGVQPILLAYDKQPLPHKPELQIKAIQDVNLTALATSTPHKVCQPNVVNDIETKQAESSCNSNNNSLIASVENTATMDKSNSNTMDSQTTDINVPDVRIFVKRRRKTIKK